MDDGEQHLRITVTRPDPDTVKITVTGDLDRDASSRRHAQAGLESGDPGEGLFRTGC